MKTRSRRKRWSPTSRTRTIFLRERRQGISARRNQRRSCPPFAGRISHRLVCLPDPRSTRADSLWSYELGAKNSLWDGRMQVNASAFVIDWNNIQQAVYLPACGQNFVENLGKVRSVGGELEVQMRPVQALLLDVSARPRRCEIYAHRVRGPDAPAREPMRRRSRS